MSTSVRHYLILLVSQGLRLPLGIASVALLAAVAGPEGIGRWALVVAATSILHSTFLNWTQGAHVRYGREEWTRTGTLRRTWRARWPWILLGISVSLAVLLLLPLTPVGRFLSLPPSWWPILVGQLLALWLAAEAQNVLQITGRMERLAVIPVVAMSLSTAYLAALSRGSRAALGAVFGGMVAVSLMVWGVTWWSEFRRTRQGLAWPDRDSLLETARYGWPAAPAFLVGYASDWGDHLLLQWWFTTREVGLFQSAYQTMVIGIGLAAPITTLLLPRLIDRSVADPSASLTYVTRVFPTIVTLWAILVLPLLAVLPRLFVGIMGARFADAVPMLTILMIAVPGAAVLQLYTVLFSVQGRLKRIALYVAYMAGVDLMVTLLLLPALGSVAAAVGTAASYVLSQSLYVADQHVHLGVSAARIVPVFVLMVAIAAAQAVVGGSVAPRLAVTAAGIVALVWTVRRGRIVDDGVVNALLTGRLRWAGEYSARLLGATTDH